MTRQYHTDTPNSIFRPTHICSEQMSYITNAEAGRGLLRHGSAIVLFVNRFPKSTEPYRLDQPGE